jgi:hypothetical protein
MATQAAALSTTYTRARPQPPENDFHGEFLPPPAGLPKFLQGAPLSGTVLVPLSLAGGYVCLAEGDCMAPTVRHDDRLVFHPRARIARGMIVGVSYHDGRQPQVKRLASDLPEPADLPPNVVRAILLEMDNPRTQFCVAWTQIERVHALVGVVRDGMWIELVANPFGNGGAPC